MLIVIVMFIDHIWEREFIKYIKKYNNLDEQLLIQDNNQKI